MLYKFVQRVKSQLVRPRNPVLRAPPALQSLPEVARNTSARPVTSIIRTSADVNSKVYDALMQTESRAEGKNPTMR